MIDVLQEYLIRIGISPPDEASYRKLVGMMAGAEATVTGSVGGMAKHILEAQGAIVGAFTSISAAIIGMADHVAMSDQRYRLMGEKMMMTTRSARELDMITKALGADLGEIVWDKELHQRAIILDQDFKRMSASMGGGFEGNMKGIRDIRFEFSRLQMGLEFFTMSFAGGLFKNLMPGDAGKKIHDWVTWFQNNASRLGEEWAKRFVPVLKETWHIMTELWEVGKSAGVAFSNFIGLLSGDESIQGAAFSFENVAKAISHIGEWMVKFFDWITHAEMLLAHFATATSFLVHGEWEKAGAEFKAGLADLGAGGMGTGAVLGAAIGGVVGGPPGAAVGATIGAGAGGAARTTGNLQKPGYAKEALGGFTGWLGGLGRGAQHAGGYLPSPQEASAALAAEESDFSPRERERRHKAGQYGLYAIPSAPPVDTWAKIWASGDAATKAGYAAFARASGWIPLGTPTPAVPTAAAAAGPAQQIMLAPGRWAQHAAGYLPSPQEASAAAAAQSGAPVQSQADLIDRIAAAITKQENTLSNPKTAPNNNPGNLHSWGDRPIVNGFAAFPDWDTGMRALREQIRKNIALGLDLQEFFGGKNTPEGKVIYPGYDKTLPTYAEQVGKALNIPVDVPLAQIAAPASAAATPPTPAHGAAWLQPAGWDGAAAQPARQRDWLAQPPQWYGAAPARDAVTGRESPASPIPESLPIIQAPPSWADKAPEWLRTLRMQSDSGESVPMPAAPPAGSDMMGQMQQQAVMPPAGAATVNSSPRFEVNVGGINIMQPGADAHQISRAVQQGVKAALDEQVMHDLLQLQGQWG